MDHDIDLSERLFEATIGTLELYSAHLGTRLGLYEALDRHGPLSAPELAERAGIAPRYAREWLEQQAVAGFLAVHPQGPDGPDTRRYLLPPAHRAALLDPIDGDHLAPFTGLVVGIAGVLDRVADAYRSGGGVSFADFGDGFRHGQGGINRPAFTTDLVKSWIPAVPGLAEALAGGARVVDLGTGLGWSAIAVKAAWPAARVVGIDMDAASVEEARAHAAGAGVDVTFVHTTDPRGGDVGADGPVDVVFVMEALHDMAHPTDVLRSVADALAPGGVVVVVDEAVADAFTAPGDLLERMMYGWSVTHCLPAGMTEDDGHPTGTVLRPSTLAALAADAGLGTCEAIDVDAGFFRVYRLAR